MSNITSFMHHHNPRTLPSMFPDLLPIEASAGAAPPASRTTTPTLFSRGERAERRFWTVRASGTVYCHKAASSWRQR